MNQHNQYSDEHINAYIDGELDSDERTRLLYDEQQDTTLAQRISDARMLKEKVQLAYADIKTSEATSKPLRCSSFLDNKKSLAASLLILLSAAALIFSMLTGNENLQLAKQLIRETPAISPDAISTAIGTHNKVVINISRYRPQDFDVTIDRIETLLQQHKSDHSFNIEIVANKDGLKALDTDTSAHAQRITMLTKQFDSLDVVACAKSMADLAKAGNPITLMKDILITPSAAQQVARRMGDGWLYLKL